MPANLAPKAPFPVRGTPGGWRDPWDEPIDHAALRAEGEATERRLGQRTAALPPAWRAERNKEQAARKAAQRRERRRTR